MSRIVRDAQLEKRAQRAKLKVQHPPHFRMIESGLHLGYRKVANGPGSWVVRRYLGDGKYSHQNLKARDGKALVVADDYEEANGISIMDYRQAQRAALALGTNATVAKAEAVATVRQAVENYKEHLKQIGGDPVNATRVLKHMPERLGNVVLASLVVADFGKRPNEREDGWKERLAKKLAPSSINRTNTVLKSALNLAAGADKRITERPWDIALATIPEADVPRHDVILADDEVRSIVLKAHEIEAKDTALFIEVMAVTGNRPSQIGRLLVMDLQADGPEPRLMMPPSFKGKRHSKPKPKTPVSIPAGLAMRLKAHADGRKAADRLLTIDGTQFYVGHHFDGFDRVIDAINKAWRTERGITPIALRHSSIVRDLKAGIHTTIVAKKHNTSGKKIEENYAAHIANHADALVRAAMLDTFAPVNPTPPEQSPP